MENNKEVFIKNLKEYLKNSANNSTQQIENKIVNNSTLNKTNNQGKSELIKQIDNINKKSNDLVKKLEEEFSR